MSNSPADRPTSPRPLPVIGLLTAPLASAVATVAVLTPIALKAMLVFSPLPHWDLDPLVFSSPMTGAGPAGFAILDLCTIVASALALLVFFARVRAGMDRPSVVGQIILGLLTLAAVGATVRWILPTPGFVLGPTLHDSRIALSWVASFAACCAMLTIGADRLARRLSVYIVAGVLLVMMAKGAQQMLVEHPKLVESFKMDRVTILGAQGWSADSASAKGYERRLMQNEPTGYFGLANVFATFAAAGVGLCVPMFARGMVAGCSRVMRIGWGVILVLCCAGVVAAGSKGGFVTALAVGGLAAVCSALAWRWAVRGGGTALGGRVQRIASGLVLGTPILMLLGSQAAIALRGMLGLRLGELSVLFRAFYIEAAWRIFGAAPVWGVGPDAFKEYYLRYKNPLSPEEVASPHSILWEWLATMGLVGLGAGVALILMVVLLGVALSRAILPARDWQDPASVTPAGVSSGHADADGDRLRSAVRLLCTPFVLILVVGTFAERFAMTPDNLVQRVGVPLVVALVMVVLFRASADSEAAEGSSSDNLCGRWEMLGLGAAGLAVVLQSQIEVTLGAHQSAPLGMAMAGLAAAGGLALSRNRLGGAFRGADAETKANAAAVHETSLALEPAGDGRFLIAPAAFGAIAVAAAALWLPGVLRWEGRLSAAAQIVSPLAEADGLMRLNGERGDATALAEAAALLTRLSGKQVATNPAAVAVAARQLQPKLIGEAEQVLAEAAALQPMDLGTLREQSRLLLLLGQMAMTRQDEATATRLLVDAVKAPPRLLLARPATLTNWFVAGLQASHKIRPDPGTMHALQAKVAEAMRLDPYNVNMSLLEWQLFVGQPSPAETEAIDAAERTLRLNENLRLDAEVKGLDARTIEQLRKYLAEHRPG